MNFCESFKAASGTTYELRCLFQAVMDNDADTVTSILRRGVDVNAQNEADNTPLIYAAGEGHAKVVRVLLDFGADIDKPGWYGYTTAIKAARNRQHPDIVKMLEDEPERRRLAAEEKARQEKEAKDEKEHQRQTRVTGKRQRFREKAGNKPRPKLG